MWRPPFVLALTSLRRLVPPGGAHPAAPGAAELGGSRTPVSHLLPRKRRQVILDPERWSPDLSDFLVQRPRNAPPDIKRPLVTSSGVADSPLLSWNPLPPRVYALPAALPRKVPEGHSTAIDLDASEHSTDLFVWSSPYCPLVILNDKLLSPCIQGPCFSHINSSSQTTLNSQISPSVY